MNQLYNCKHNSRIRLAASMLAVFFLGFSIVACSQSPKDQRAFNKMVDGLIDHSVPTISATALDSLGLDGVTLLDAREWNEYQVSHLKGAEWVGYNSLQTRVINTLPKDKPVVVYCSVGYRSEKIAEKLKGMGFEHVTNLYGGIFDWVNSGKTVVDQQAKVTSKVHAYNKSWGKWLKKGEKVY